MSKLIKMPSKDGSIIVEVETTEDEIIRSAEKVNALLRKLKKLLKGLKALL